MKIENKFYLTKKESFKIIPDQAYNLETGETYETIGDSLVESINVSSVKIVRLAINIEYSHITMLWWNSENTYKGHVELNSKQGSYTDITLPQDAYYIGFLISGTTATIYYSQTYCEVEKLSMIVPHYKELKKKYKKENRQMFFRESLDGKITLFRSDYLLVKNASIEDTLMFYIYRNDNLYASASFNKTDCKFDHIKKKVELELNYNDKYSNVLDAFDNTSLRKCSFQRELCREFIQNHIALYNYSISESSSDSLVLMNGKKTLLSASSFCNSPILSTNGLYNNGVLFTIQGKAHYFPTVFEYLRKDADLDSLANFFYNSRFYRKEFIPGRSVPGGLVDGKTVYLDSVFAQQNDLWDMLWAYTNEEDSTYWMVAPTNKEWKKLIEEYERRFNCSFPE